MRAKPADPQLLTQLLDLLMMELANWRWSWHSMILTGMLAPITSLLALHMFAHDAGSLGYILTGNMIMSLLFGNLDKVCSRFSYMRFAGTLDYFATLPVSRGSVVAASACSFLLLSLPGLATTALIGAIVLHLPLHVHWTLAPTVVLGALSLAGVGAILGCKAHTPQEAGAFSLMTTLAMVSLGPVIIPPDRLPAAIIALGKLSPATYAASALRQALLGPVESAIWRDLAVLALFSAVSLCLAGRWIDWRQE